MDYQDLAQYSHRELYRIAKRDKDLLEKRYKRLKAAYEKDKNSVSKHGLNKYDEEGIQHVSTTMSKNELKRSIMKNDYLKNMKTSTVSGARRHMKELKRLMAGVPKQGRLKKDDRTKLAKVEADINKDDDFIEDFWEAFHLYQSQMKHRNLPSGKAYDEFKPVFKDLHESNNNIADIKNGIRELGDQDYKSRKLNKGQYEDTEWTGGK